MLDKIVQIEKKYVDEIVAVSDYELMEAFLLLVEKHKLVAENSGILPLAGLKKLDCKAKKAVAIVSGGNIDVTILNRVINRGLEKDGRIGELTIDLADKPGQLLGVSSVIAEMGANVIGVIHERNSNSKEVNACELRIKMETRNADHIEQIKEALVKKGFHLKERQ